MKTILRGLVAGAVLSVVGAGSVDAQNKVLNFNVNTAPYCNSWTITPAPLGGWTRAQSAAGTCWGAVEGNSGSTSAQAQIVDYLNSTQSGWNVYGPWTSLGKTDATDSDPLGNGPFNPFANATSGTLTFDNTIYGNFVIALKAGSYFNLYRFDAPGGINSISFSGLNNALSNASLYQGSRSVPEPSTILLLATGLLGLALIRRREGRFVA